MPTVYLGGKLGDRTYWECAGERSWAKQLLEERGISVLNPLRGKGYLAGKTISRHKKPGGMDIAEIIARDKYDLKRSDLLLILTGDEVSDGTWLEFGYAKYKLDIPVVMVAPTRIGQCSWSNHEADYIARSLEEAVNWIANYFFA